MKRPSLQFYPADWRNNAKLRRCSWAARGAWIELLGLLHDSDTYGALHWPLKEIAQALGCPTALLRELADKDVLKGCDAGDCTAYVYVPRSGRKDGEPVTLVQTQPGPVWFSARLVRDEYVRNHAGANTRFTTKPPDECAPNHSPSRREGANQGDGSTSSSSSTSTSLKQKRVRRAPQIPLPDGFAISDRVRTWAAGKGYDHLEAHLENFVSKARAKGYVYVDWDEGFMGAVQKDWAGLRVANGVDPDAAAARAIKAIEDRERANH